MRDGFFSSSAQSITQTADGYLWIGTEAGLVRFDGVRFLPWKPPTGQQLDDRIFHVLGTRDGSLWVATSKGLSRIRAGNIVTLDTGRIGAIQEDAGGDGVWVVRSRRMDDGRGPLGHVTDRGIRIYGRGAGIPIDTAGHLVRAKDGGMWLGGRLGFVRWSPPANATLHFQKELERDQGLFGVNAIAAGADGSLWASIEEPGAPAAIRRFTGKAWSIHPLPRTNDQEIAVLSLFVDRDHAVWIGTTSHGIYRFHRGTFDHFGTEDGLSGNGAGAFYQDHEGSLWLATTQGIDVFRDSRVTSYSVREGLSADSVSSVVADAKGNVWIGNVGSLDVLRDGRISSLRARDGLPGQTITALLADHAGRLWAGIDEELWVYESGEFRRIARPDGGPLGFVITLAEDADHDVWARAEHNIYRIRDLRVQEILDIPSALPPAVTLAADPRGGLWLGWQNGGLARYHRGRLEQIPPPQGSKQGTVLDIQVDPDGSVWAIVKQGLIRVVGKERRLLTMSNGLPCEGFYGLQKDDRGALWLYSQCGLVAIERPELTGWWARPDTKVKMRILDPLDGAQPGMATFLPSATKTPDGRLWFANDRILQMVDPARLDGNRQPPRVHIEQVVADRKAYPLRRNLRLPALTRDLQIDYTALSFMHPQKVRFRYKLENRDRDWQDPQARRQAFYSDLRPGQYRFRVIACNNDGVWNQAGATLDFSIAAAWYQTSWFRVLCVFCAIAAAWVLVRLRLRQIARNLGARFDERLAERTRIAREFHDTLLQTIQASKMVADDAMSEPGDPVRARRSLERLSDWLGRAVEEGRQAVNSLRTSATTENDLARALRLAAEHSGKPDSMAFSLSVDGTPREMHPIVRDEIYRIGYEAIRNACAHSGASRLDVELRYKRDLTLRIKDNGTGIAGDIVRSGRDGHFGLTGMRERAARIGAAFHMTTSAAAGTEITLVVPSSALADRRGTEI